MEQEVSCINSRAILDYVESRAPGSTSALIRNLHPEIDFQAAPEAYLRDPNNWISCTVATELYRRAKTLLKDELAAYKIARHAIENTTMGYTQRILIKAFGTEHAGLKHAQRVNDKWNRNKKVELVKLEKDNAVIRLHWNADMDITKDLCLMNQGTYTFIPNIWGSRPADLTEVCCFFEGAPYCEYHVKWEIRSRIKRLYTRFFGSRSVLMDTILEMEKDKKIIEQKYEEVNNLNVALNQKIKQLMAIQETGKAILTVLDLDQLLAVIMKILYDTCRINRALVFLVNKEKKHLEYIHGVGFRGKVPEAIINYKIPTGRRTNILSRVAMNGESEYVEDVKHSDLRKDNLLLKLTRPSSLFAIPLITGTNVIGVIATDGIDSGGVPRETRETLDIFAPQIAIAIQNANMYRTLKEQMQELIQSQNLLKRAEKLSFLGNLAARLAHEIKNPMTAMGTFMQMLPKKYNDQEFINEFYEIAMEETARINNLITELLDLTKTKKPQFESTDLNALINRMMILVSPQSKAKRIQILPRLDSAIGMVKMDPEKIKQTLLNIVTNAVDFTPEGGTIKIETMLRQENHAPPTVQIRIADSGPGIDAEMIEKVFDPYFTTKSKSDMHSGTGLGLFIAHQNIQDHGGNIEIISHPEQGTTFVLTIADIEAEQTEAPH